MVALNLSPEASKAPEWLLRALPAVVISMLDRERMPSGDAVEVTSIVYNAEVQRASMVARITPALENVRLDFVVKEDRDAEGR